MTTDLWPGAQNLCQGLTISLQVGDEEFNFTFGAKLVNGLGQCGKVTGSAFIEVIARNRGDHRVAQLQPGVIGDLVECDGKWCELAVGSYSGYVQQKKLWGCIAMKNSSSRIFGDWRGARAASAA